MSLFVSSLSQPADARNAGVLCVALDGAAERALGAEDGLDDDVVDVGPDRVRVDAVVRLEVAEQRGQRPLVSGAGRGIVVFAKVPALLVHTVVGQVHEPVRNVVPARRHILHAHTRSEQTAERHKPRETLWVAKRARPSRYT